MTIVFDEVQATIEPPQPGGKPELPSSPARAPERPQVPLEQQLRFVRERQARLFAD